MSDAEDSKVTPPYGSFATFWNYVTALKADQLPPQLDRSMMRGKSGSDQVVIIAGLKFFGLVDTEKNNEVLPALKELVAASGEERKRTLERMVRTFYPEQIAVSDLPGTEQQLHQSFEDAFGVKGETRRKVSTFFIHAATAAGMTVSPHFPKARPGQGRPGGTAKKATAAKKKAGTPAARGAVKGQSDEGGDSYTVELAAGGSVQLIVNADLMALLRNATDREFVTELISKMETYEGVAPDADEDADEEEGDDS